MVVRGHGGQEDRYRGFPDGFFDRADDSRDDAFYVPPRLVTHIDEAAIAAVGSLYEELGLSGVVLDLCASWISHFRTAPAGLVLLCLNAVELARNTHATAGVVHDLNEVPGLPFADGSFDAATCCVSIDYLVHPLEVFDEVARVLRPGAPFVCTFSNRCFPTKAIRGWLATDDAAHLDLVTDYFRRSRGWGPVTAARRTPLDHRGDPLLAVWAHHDRPPR